LRISIRAPTIGGPEGDVADIDFAGCLVQICSFGQLALGEIYDDYLENGYLSPANLYIVQETVM
jgi:hypothetical protein